MIKMLRLDERLIHGQITIKWSRHLGVDRMVVLNDEAANNELIRKSLLMAAPGSVKTTIKGMDDGIALLNDPRGAPFKMLALAALPEEVLRILQEVPGIQKVNVGNYGRVAPRQGTEHRKTYSANLYLYPNEVEILRQIINTGVECVYQTTPEDPPTPLKDVIK
jgi:PTS system mannose-specific IIB component